MPLTRMPCGPSSSAIAFVRFTTPALAATNAHCSRKRHEAGDRRDVDDPAARPLSHRGRSRAAHLVNAGQVDGEDAVPLSRGNWSMVTRWASVLTPALLTRMSSRPHSATICSTRVGDLIGPGHVEPHEAPVGRSRRGGLRFLSDEIGVVNDAAIRRESVGDGLADSPRRSGDQANLARQVASS